MEGFVDVWISYITGYKRKFLTLRNFLLVINEYNEKDNETIEEKKYHIKYISISEISGTNIKLFVENIEETLFMRTLNEEDILNWSMEIKSQKARYKVFLEQYYCISNENLIPSDSIFDYLASIEKFISDFEQNLSEMKIDSSLESILNIQNTFLDKIKYYNTVIESNYFKLNSNNKDELHLITRSKEVKCLLDELKDTITSCSYGLSSYEIEEYIANFKHVMKEKVREIRRMMEEIKYILECYILNKRIHDEENDKQMMLYSMEDELKKVMLECELLKIQIEKTERENEIIKQFIVEDDTNE